MTAETYKAPVPQWSKLKGEHTRDQKIRVKAEEDAFLKAYEVDYRKADGDTKEEWAKRVAKEEEALWEVLDKLEEDVIELSTSESMDIDPHSIMAGFRKMSSRASEIQHDNKSAELDKLNPPRKRAQAAITLKALQEYSQFGEYYARHITERLAKAWSNGEHRPKFRIPQPGEVLSSGELNAQQNAATGVTIQGALDTFKECTSFLTFVDANLADPIDAKAAEEIYDAYDDALDKYWEFVRAITAGLKKDNVRQYLGPAYKPHFEAHLKAFEAPSKKIVDLVGPKLDSKTPHAKPRSPLDMRPNLSYLDVPQTPEKLQSWADRTKEYLKEGLVATGG